MSIGEQDRFLSLQTLLICLILNGTAKTELDKQLEDNRGFPKVDHSGIDARIVLEQINSAKKATCNRT